jgi:diguanylate cyclase (GGDEF)-like protein
VTLHPRLTSRYGDAVRSTPMVSGVVAGLLGVIASIQFSAPASQSFGISVLYLWPVTIAALWFGTRIAVLVVCCALLLQIGWYVAVPHLGTPGNSATAVILRGATYLFVASVVGSFAQRLRRLALTDPLTCLPNRRAFFEEAHRRAMLRPSLGVVACDVDGLKSINDRHGHTAGDRAITDVGRALQALVGRSGYVCRVGGDEFLALTTPETALRIASMHRPIPGGQVGVSVHSTIEPARIDESIAVADRSLYRAKRQAAEERARIDHRVFTVHTGV